MSMEKFGINYEECVRIVGHYLLKEWLLKACFENLHIEGLIKEFYLGAYCKKNLQLTKDILYSMMTFREWEVPTPANEKLTPEQAGGDPLLCGDLFSLTPEKKAKHRQHIDDYYRELLQLDSDKTAKNIFQVDQILKD